MSVSPSSLTRSSSSDNLTLEDVECSICLEVLLDPVTPAAKNKWSWKKFKKEKTALCIHSFCKECFEKLTAKSCPLCRRDFIGSVSNIKLKEKVARYIQRTFNTSYEEYKASNRFSIPNFENISVWLKCKNYDEAGLLIKQLSPEQRDAGFSMLINKCLAEKEYLILEKLLLDLPENLKLVVLEILCNIYIKEIDADIERAESFMTFIDDKLFALGDIREVIPLKDNLVSVLANKYHKEGNLNKAIEMFLKLSVGDKDESLFHLLYDSCSEKSETGKASTLLDKMSMPWKKKFLAKFKETITEEQSPSQSSKIQKECMLVEIRSLNLESSQKSKNLNLKVLFFSVAAILAAAAATIAATFSASHEDN